MSQSPGFLLTILAFMVVIGPLVFIHEMGHYLAGRWFGIGAETFSIGFGRELVGWTDRRGTRWKIGWLPLGGYVKFAGDMNAIGQPSADWLALPAAERNRTFQSKPVWQRAIVVAAGPLVNLAAAVLIFAAFAMSYGVDTAPATVGGVQPGSAAAAAGLRTGDRITGVAGRSVASFSDLASYTLMHPRERATISYVRDGRPAQLAATIGAAEEVDRFGNRYVVGRLGLVAGKPVFTRVGPLSAVARGVEFTVGTVRGTIDGLGQIVTGRRSVKELGGPLKIAQVSGEQATLGVAALVWLAAMISINLGFINLLPVPLLDGGHLFFYAIEAVRRRPVTPEVQEWAFRGGLAAILALMLLVTFNDLGSLGLWQRLAGLIG